MFDLPIFGTSLVFLALHLFISIAAVGFARTHLVRVQAMWSGQTRTLATQISRFPAAERMHQLAVKARSASIESRMATEALQLDERLWPSVIDSVLAEIQLDLDQRSHWPRAAARISAASGVLFMALTLALRLEVFVAVVLFIGGMIPAVICLAIDRRAESMAVDLRRDVDALVDVLDLRDVADARHVTKTASVKSRRHRR